MKYGYKNIARDLIQRTIEMVSATGEPLSTENYPPRNPQKYELSHNIFSYGWGGLPNDLLLRRVLGIQPRMDRNELELNPLWMEGLTDIEVEGLHLGSHRLNINYHQTKNGMDIQIRDDAKKSMTVSTQGKKQKLPARIKMNFQKSNDKPHHWLND